MVSAIPGGPGGKVAQGAKKKMEVKKRRHLPTMEHDRHVCWSQATSQLFRITAISRHVRIREQREAWNEKKAENSGVFKTIHQICDP